MLGFVKLLSSVGAGLVGLNDVSLFDSPVVVTRCAKQR